jgi:hypothetical protein
MYERLAPATTQREAAKRDASDLAILAHGGELRLEVGSGGELGLEHHQYGVEGLGRAQHTDVEQRGLDVLGAARDVRVIRAPAAVGMTCFHAPMTLDVSRARPRLSGFFTFTTHF